MKLKSLFSFKNVLTLNKLLTNTIAYGLKDKIYVKLYLEDIIIKGVICSDNDYHINSKAFHQLKCHTTIQDDEFF